MCFFILFYLSIVLIWLLLGAIINPNNYLVYATAMGTLITVSMSKYSEIKLLFEKGFTEVKEIVEQNF